MRDLLWRCDEHRGPDADFPALRGKLASIGDRFVVSTAFDCAIGLATERAPTIPRNRDPPDERFRLWAGAAARDRVGDVRMEWSCLLVGRMLICRVCW